MRLWWYSFILICIAPWLVFSDNEQPRIRIGSKIFTEGYLLGELLAQKLESHGFLVERALGLGATGVTEEALRIGSIDLIVDYTGSLTQAHFSGQNFSIEELTTALTQKGISISKSLGFNNTYILAGRPEWAAQNGIKKFSDLSKLENIRAAFTPEFTSRRENWKNLKKEYGFSNFEVFQMDHQLAYEAVKSGRADIVEAYSTDAKLKEYGLVAFQDDRRFFPDYSAVIVAKTDWVNENPKAWAILLELEGTLSSEKMIELNSQVDLAKKSFSEVIRQYFGFNKKPASTPLWSQIAKDALEHLELVLFPIIIGSIIALPMAYASYRRRFFVSIFGGMSTFTQTIPGLALLTFLIPILGIGRTPALVSLTLYALLPLYVSFVQGLNSVTPLNHTASLALGMNRWQKFRWVEWPTALPAVLSGVQTAAVTTVANATLAALIGAGGFGKRIVAGLAVNNYKIVLEGAIPSALMALTLFFIIERIKSYLSA